MAYSKDVALYHNMFDALSYELTFDYWIGSIDGATLNHTRIRPVRDYPYGLVDITDLLSHKRVNDDVDTDAKDNVFHAIIWQYLKQLPKEHFTNMRSGDMFLISTPWCRVVFKLLGSPMSLKNSNLSKVNDFLTRIQQIDLDSGKVSVLQETLT